MTTLEIRNEKMQNADNYRTLCEVLEKVVPSVLARKDGKVYNKTFIALLEEVASEEYGTFTLHGHERNKFYFTDCGETHVCGDVYKREIEVTNYEMVAKLGYNVNSTRCKFAICCYLDEKRNTRISNEKSECFVGDGSWYLPTWKDCIANLQKVIAEYEKCTTEKMDLCKEKLKEISAFIEKTLDGMETRENGFRMRYNGIIGLSEAIKEVKEGHGEEYKALEDLAMMLRW